ncbi:hypothetical protein GCM10009639_17690 [Kitasatospora putterlickiae]|uniref:Uncharacterized protein n=1 Tax=Kitasatospora putterlickiae TaxID=221725 RepID=A0ABN1XTS1_9ACTN
MAVLRDAPADWPLAMGRQGTDGDLLQIDLGYHLPDNEPVATVSTSRQLVDPVTALWNFLANSGRGTDGLGDLPHLGRDIRLDSLLIPVHVHHHQDCFTARLPRLPHDTGCVTVTGLTAYWPVLSALVMREPADFPDSHLHSRQPPAASASVRMG